MQIKHWTTVGAAALCFGWVGVAMGATADGALGSTSVGTVDVTVIKGEVAQLSGLVAINFGNWTNGDGDITTQQNVCVYANDPGGDYFVTGRSNTGGPGLGNEFRLTDGGGNFVHYQVGWTDSTGSNFAGSTAGGVGLPLAGHGLVSVNQDAADQASTNCGGGTTATLSVFVAEAGPNGLTAAPEGTFTDELEVTIDPN